MIAKQNMIKLILDTNWTAIGAISNISVAFLALISICVSLYLNRKNSNQRKEEIRARLSLSIVNWKNMYMLKISNVGKETAYNVHLIVEGKPVVQNLFDFVRQTFEKLSKMSFCIEAGQSVFYLLSPDEHFKGHQGLEGGESISSSSILKWLQFHDNEDIIINGTYCDKYKINENFSIREFSLKGSFEHLDAIEEIADASLSRDPSDNYIQKSISAIAKAVGNSKNTKS